MAKNKRLKSGKKALIQIESWEDADAYVRKIGDMQLEIQRAEADAKSTIDEAKATLAAIAKPLQKDIKVCVDSIEAFAAGHKKDFVGSRRSKDLNHGKIGWRKSFAIAITKNTLGLIKDMFTNRRAAGYIRIKETVDKNALANLTDEELASVDARRERTEAFFVEPFMPEAVDYEPGKHYK